jgi:hypothetical protein
MNANLIKIFSCGMITLRSLLEFIANPTSVHFNMLFHLPVDSSSCTDQPDNHPLFLDRYPFDKAG